MDGWMPLLRMGLEKQRWFWFVQLDCSRVQKHSKAFSNTVRKRHSDADQVLEWVVSAGEDADTRSWTYHEWEHLSPQLYLRQAVPVWGGEGKDVQIRTVIAENTRWQILYVFGCSLSQWCDYRGIHSVRRVTLESSQSSEAGIWHVLIFSLKLQFSCVIFPSVSWNLRWIRNVGMHSELPWGMMGMEGVFGEPNFNILRYTYWNNFGWA